MESGSAEWHEQRRKVIGGSQVAGILGIKGAYQGGRDVYDYMVDGKGVNDEPTEAMVMGSTMEPIIAALYLARHDGLNLREPKGPTQNKDLPEWVGGIPDRKVFQKAKFLRLFEAKNVGPMPWARGFKEEANEMPQRVYVQCLWYLLSHPKAERLDLGVLACGNHYAEFQVEHHHKTEQRLFNMLGEWYHKHIELGTPPPPRDSRDPGKLRQELYPPGQKTEVIVQATPDISEIAFRLRDTLGQIERLEADATGISETIKDFIKNNEGVEGAFGLLRYKYDSKGRTSWKAVADAYAAVVHELNIDAHSDEEVEKAKAEMQARLDAIVNDSVGVPSRKFTTAWAETR